jgi:hypothetical protein
MSTWFAFKGYDTINLAGIQEKYAVAIGFHGYATEAQANQNPNSVSFLQKPWLNAVETDYKLALAEHAQPGGANASNPLGATGQAVQTGVSDAANAAASSLGLPKLSNTRDFVVRAMKVIIGAMLIIIGVSSLLKGEGISVPKAVPVPV